MTTYTTPPNDECELCKDVEVCYQLDRNYGELRVCMICREKIRYEHPWKENIRILTIYITKFIRVPHIALSDKNGRISYTNKNGSPYIPCEDCAKMHKLQNQHLNDLRKELITDKKALAKLHGIITEIPSRVKEKMKR